MNLGDLGLVALGGFVGAVCRYSAGRTAARRFPSPIPYGTLTINLAGAFLIGLFTGITSENNAWGILLVPGLTGAMTTFSTVQWESIELLQNKRPGIFVQYSLATYIPGFLLTYAGMILAS